MLREIERRVYLKAGDLKLQNLVGREKLKILAIEAGVVSEEEVCLPLPLEARPLPRWTVEPPNGAWLVAESKGRVVLTTSLGVISEDEDGEGASRAAGQARFASP